MKFTSVFYQLSIVIALFLFYSLTLFANNEGIIHYNIQYNVQEISPQIKQNLPENVSVSFKGDKIRLDFKAKSGIEMANIINTNQKLFIVLMSKDHHKMAFKIGENEIERHSDKYGILNVKLLNENKKIAGFNCKKAIVIYEREEPVTVYYTDEITSGGNNLGTQFEGVPGVLMEFSMKQGDASVIFSAEKVEFKTIDNSLFNIPPGYQVISGEDALQHLQFAR